MIGSILGFHLWNHAHNLGNTRSILTKLLLKIDIYVFYLNIQRFIDNYLKLIKYLRFSGHAHSRTHEIAYIHACHAPPFIHIIYRKCFHACAEQVCGLLSFIWELPCWKISPETLTFARKLRSRFALDRVTGIVRFEFIFLNYSAITQSNA